ncbi:MAG: phage integrase N-terminal SAM-like domain-containing protein [Candidatus Marinimicrobia bacterium]|nr:phage integrase N-terminal SAM-like domain-containing protein [Candidatus Neomarinimicrobiota bacterium]
MSKLLDSVSEKIRVRHYSYKTELAYKHWIKQYVLYNNKIHPNGLGRKEFNGFLTYLAMDRNVSASTQNLVRNAVLFLYKYVLEKNIGDPKDYVIAKRSRKVPTVFSQEEVKKVLAQLERYECIVC